MFLTTDPAFPDCKIPFLIDSVHYFTKFPIRSAVLLVLELCVSVFAGILGVLELLAEQGKVQPESCRIEGIGQLL